MEYIENMVEFRREIISVWRTPRVFLQQISTFDLILNPIDRTYLCTIEDGENWKEVNKELMAGNWLLYRERALQNCPPLSLEINNKYDNSKVIKSMMGPIIDGQKMQWFLSVPKFNVT